LMPPLSIKSCPLLGDAPPPPPTQSGDALNMANGELRMRRAASMACEAGARSGRGTSLVVGRRGRRCPSARALHGRLGDVRAWRLHG
jgi:hypothetical protein